MKILYYIEPYPIRESFTQFYWVAEKIIQMILDEKIKVNSFLKENTFKIVCSRHIHKKLLEKFNNINEHLIGLTSSENDYLENIYDPEWNKEAIRKWENLLNGEGDISDYFYDLLKRIYHSYSFDVILYWGSNGSIKMFSNDYDIPAIAMELGCTRVPFFESVYFDYQGVNGASYLHNLNIENFQSKHNLEAYKALIPVSNSYNRSLFDGPTDNLNYDFSETLYKNIGKNILIPLQLTDDVNIILYSKYNSMLDFLRDVIPKLTKNGYKCFIKPHPGAKARLITQADHDNCKNYCEKNRNVVWMDHFTNGRSLISLYNKMDYCVVVNSSVGFEMMLLGKVVVNLGKAPYTLSTPLTIDDIISGVDEVLYKFNAEKIINIMLFHYLHFKHEAFDFPLMMKAIKLNITLREYSINNNDFNCIVKENRILNEADYLFYPNRIE